ncbi:MAG: hypothetical protein AAGC53_03880 [Actinomycetota bacterium]
MSVFWQTVFAGLVVAGVVGLRSFVWKRRAAFAEALRAPARHIRDRSKRRGTAERAELVRHVLLRSEVTGVEVPVKVGAGEPTRITLHPTGRTIWGYSNSGSYTRGVMAGKSDPRNSFVLAKPYRPVGDWPTEELRKWLREHRDTPAAG